jgi:hypothetical protein
VSSHIELRLDTATLLRAVDLAVGVAGVAGEAARGMLEPSFLPERLRPARALAVCVRPVARRGRHWRERLTTEAVAALDTALPVVLDVAMKRLQPTDLVRQYVDLDALVGSVDLDAVAERLDVQAVVARVDVDEIAARLDVEAVLDRMDLTATVLRRVDLRTLVDTVLAQVDVDAIAARLDVEAVLDRIDLTSTVLHRVDLRTLVDTVLAQVDVDAIAARLDVEAVLDRMDLTATVLQRVDLQALVDAVLTQVDVPALVEQVLDEIDLPEIIRASTGTMASDTVQTVRMQGVNADEAVSRLVDRLRVRHHRPAPGGATQA